jgi:acyl carrier protein
VSWLSRIFGGRPEVPEPGAAEPTAPTDGAGQEASSSHGDIVAALRQFLRTAAENNGKSLGTVDVRDDIDIYEAGYVDSITASAFLVLAEKKYRVQLPDWLIGGQVNTLDKLARYIEDQLSSRR